jgi:hypothetical protein
LCEQVNESVSTSILSILLNHRCSGDRVVLSLSLWERGWGEGARVLCKPSSPTPSPRGRRGRTHLTICDSKNRSYIKHETSAAFETCMFHFLVKYDGWRPDRDSIDETRVFEYTDKKFARELRPKRNFQLDRVVSLPAVFASEMGGSKRIL